ncbi:MAG TPA: class I SAM-dependent methyltransferase [Melioribacteraceae bacterium]|nr:class I SAM-dependent methyltransferase [Melioribacteraceae bacterium]
MNALINGESILEYLLKNRKPYSQLEKEMEEYAKERQIPILDYKSAELLELLIELKQPETALEIGTAIAYSSIKIAKRMLPNGKLDTIEKSKDNLPLALKYINNSGLNGKINVIFGDAIEILANSDKTYDFIFLDADKQDYEKLFNLSLPLLNNNGIIFIDNLLWKGYVAENIEDVPKSYKTSTEQVTLFNKLFLNNKYLESQIFPIGDGIGVGIKRT